MEIAAQASALLSWDDITHGLTITSSSHFIGHLAGLTYFSNCVCNYHLLLADLRHATPEIANEEISYARRAQEICVTRKCCRFSSWCDYWRRFWGNRGFGCRRYHYANHRCNYGWVDFSNYYLPLSSSVKTGLALVDAKTAGAVLAYGSFITATLNFLIIAFVLFLVIQAINRLKKKEVTAPATPPAPTTSEKLLEEIRDLLKK